MPPYSHGVLTRAIGVFLLLLPWLNPFAPAPTSQVVQSLLSLSCLALLLPMPLWQGGGAALVSVAAPAWLLAALLSCLIALLQYFGVSQAFAPWVNTTGVGEAFANLRQRNQFATLTNMGLAALLCWVQIASPTRSSGPMGGRVAHWRAPACLFAAALLGVGNAASSSRTGLLELLLLAFLLLAWPQWRRPPVRRVMLAAGAAYVSASLLLPWLAGLSVGGAGILARMQEGGSGCASRLTLWQNVAYLVGEKPWAGWGWGELDYAHFITLYPGPRFCDILSNAHNLPLHLAVELGLPVATLLCGGGLWVLWRAQPWRQPNPTRQLAWAVLAILGVHSLLEYPLWYGPFQLAAGLALTLLWLTRPAAVSAPPAGRSATPLTVAPELWRLAMATSLLLAVLYAAWDYQRIRQIYLPVAERAAPYRDNTIAKLQGSWLFGPAVDFAELTTTVLSPANALAVQSLAEKMLHFSPEPRVIEPLLDSLRLQDQDEALQFYLARYQAAFAGPYARWVSRNGR
jgi:O-antigen ligase